jgi:hypothetical protein
VSVGNCPDHQTLKGNAVHGPDQSRNSRQVLGHPMSTLLSCQLFPGVDPPSLNHRQKNATCDAAKMRILAAWRCTGLARKGGGQAATGGDRGGWFSRPSDSVTSLCRPAGTGCG